MVDRNLGDVPDFADLAHRIADDARELGIRQFADEWQSLGQRVNRFLELVLDVETDECGAQGAVMEHRAVEKRRMLHTELVRLKMLEALELRLRLHVAIERDLHAAIAAPRFEFGGEAVAAAAASGGEVGGVAIESLKDLH